MKENTFYVVGMTCDGCRNHVIKALEKVDGVETVSVDLESGKTVIESGHTIDVEMLKSTLLDSNYANWDWMQLLLLLPFYFPDQVNTPQRTAHVYFEASTMISNALRLLAVKL